MSLKASDQISSFYVYLPVANRSYFAIWRVTGFDYHVMHADMRETKKYFIRRMPSLREERKMKLS